MSTFKIMLRAYRNNKILSRATIIFLILGFIFQMPGIIEQIIYINSRNANSFPAAIGDNFKILSVVIFFFFLFVSYYFFNLKNNFLFSECLSSIVNKKCVLFLAQTAILLLIAIPYIAFFALTDIAVVLYSRCATSEYIFSFVIRFYILYGFLTSILAILIGGALALSQKKSAGVVWIFLIFILTVCKPVAELIPLRFSEWTGSGALYWFNYLFYIFFPSMRTPAHYAVYSFRFQLILAWICLLLFINLRGYFNVNKTVLKGVAAALLSGSLCFFIFFLMPASRVLADANYYAANNASRDFYYYEYDKKVVLKEEKADFKVTHYDIKFKIKRNLSAEATLTLDKNELPEYKFTLYHGYKVKKVTDENGKKLKFNQDTDYVTVYSDGALNKIIMFYSGDGGNYYSNAVQTLLPGWFPFYPQSGFKKLYDKEYGGCYNALTLEEKADFKVKIDTPKKVYSNLDETAPNEFSGFSESLCLAAGFYKQVEVNGVSVIAPFRNNIFSVDLKEIEKKIEYCITRGVFNSQVKKIILLQPVGYGNLALYPFSNLKVYSDYMNAESVNGEHLRDVVDENIIGRKRADLYKIFWNYNFHNEYYYGTLNWAASVFGDEFPETEYYLYELCRKKYGDGFMNDKCFNYIASQTEERDGRQFLRDLLENGA